MTARRDEKADAEVKGMLHEVFLKRLEETLKPCPFCGGKARLEDMGWPHHVYCEKCGARVESTNYAGEGEKEACAKWNKRNKK